MFMSDVQTEKKFEAKIPMPLWDQWEKWAQGRPKLQNPQIFIGFMRLFLLMSRDVQMKALSGTEEELRDALHKEGIDIAASAKNEVTSRLEAARAVLRKMSPQARESLPRELIVLLPIEEESTTEPKERKRKTS